MIKLQKDKKHGVNKKPMSYSYDIKERTYNFALDIVELTRVLVTEKHEHILSKQLLRSGTSIGANVEEAQSGQSSKDFIAKMFIALKEAREANYWLRLLFDSGYISSRSLIDESGEIIKVLASIIRKAREREGMSISTTRSSSRT